MHYLMIYLLLFIRSNVTEYVFSPTSGRFVAASTRSTWITTRTEILEILQIYTINQKINKLLIMYKEKIKML